ncbi:MAG: hypothetical protein GX488_06040, partial [Clostridiales bacterium]|nr:hypothetical protein [Clostridiales bacterium]
GQGPAPYSAENNNSGAGSGKSENNNSGTGSGKSENNANTGTQAGTADETMTDTGEVLE